MSHHPYSQAATNCGQTEPDKVQEYTCFLCDDEFEVLDLMPIEGQPVCPFCKLRTRDELLSLLVEEKQARIEAERRLEKMWYDQKHKMESNDDN